MSFKPWHKVMDPRSDLREHKPLDAAEFAVHLDLVRDKLAPDEYKVPSLFFERTYLTQNLTQLAAEVIGRLSGEVHGANAVFNLTTQFGGGKTHALTLLYHLATHGPDAIHWFGVDRLLKIAGVSEVPKAATAVFVGTEFDSLRGRGGNDGTPLRKTPWGEIAYQLGGEDGFKLVAEHERQLIAPAGDVIRELLPTDEPCLILMDELINYMSRNRKQGLADQLYNFIQSLSEAVRSRDNVVLVVSLPKAANEMTAEDESDYQRFIKLLGRVSKPVAIASETEVSEIIRRRLFEWDRRAVGQDGRMILDADAKAVCKAYAEWVVRHRSLLSPEFPFDQAQQEFEATYPFHPTVISLFQRKWRSLPQFQQTRGILKLLAQWVSEVFKEGYLRANRDLLISLGTAPLEELSFRDAVVSQQLNEDRLKAVITTDISGREDAHALSLDRHASEEIARRRLHRKIATTLLFESNGGQTDARASLPEIRLAVGEPDLDIGEIEPALERLIDACYYLTTQGQKYSFSVRPNLNKLLADRRATISMLQLEERVHKEIEAIFAKGPTLGLDRKYFPTVSTDLPNRPLLTLAVVAPEQVYQSDANSDVQKLIKKLTIEYGESYRTFKNALIWCVADASGVNTLYTEAGKLLALEALGQDEYAEFDETQSKQLAEAKKRAERDLREAVWRSYRYLMLLDKENTLRTIDLGLVHSSAANTLADLIVRELRQAGEVVETIGVNYLLRNWPAFNEWSTKAIREAVLSSPRFPRLLNLDSLRATFAQGVTNGQIAYVGKKNGDYEPFCYKTELRANEIEFSDEMFLITGNTAEAYLAAKAAAAREEARSQEVVQPEELSASPGVVKENGATLDLQTQGASVQVLIQEPTPEENGEKPIRKLTWRGEIPAQKWTTFYLKVLSRFATGGGLKLTLQMDLSPEGGVSRQKLEETRIALRELGLPESALQEES
jgi:hypothetical protein